MAYHDIGVIEMNTPVTLSDSIHPICLPKFPNQNPDHLKYRSTSVVGYGANKIKDGKTEIQDAKFEIYPISYCNNTHSRSNPINALKIRNSLPELFQDDLICAGDSFRDESPLSLTNLSIYIL